MVKESMLNLFLLLFSTLGFSKAFLIGGTVAQPKDYPATVMIDGCTAAKIGPRSFLTAAHCVLDPDTNRLAPTQSPNAKIVIKSHATAALLATIENVYVHPSYSTELARLIRERGHRNGVSFIASDVAIIKVKETTAQIDEAQLDFSAIGVGETVVIGGYGCEDRSIMSSVQLDRYKIAEVRTIANPNLARDPYGRNTSRVMTFNFLTAGKKLDEKSASICPGDSGGPVYRKSDGALIGVNSQYLFNDRSSISYANTHTRLSRIRAWIQSVP